MSNDPQTAQFPYNYDGKKPMTVKEIKIQQCPPCNGTGEVAPYRKTFAGGSVNTTDCPLCLGKGYNP